MFDRSRTPPVAAQQPHTLTAHGHERQDPYFWLSERDSGAVLDHLHAENDYTQAVMAPLALLQKQLYAEMRARYKEDEQSPPYKDGEYWYYERNIEGSEYPVYARRHLTLDAPEEVLLDVNVIAAEHEYCAVRGLEVSPDHRRLAYAVDTVGNRQYVLYLVELTTGRLLAEPLSATAPGVVWTADNDNVFVVRNDATTLRPYELVLYGVSADAESLWQEQDDTYGLFINATRSEDYVQLMSLSTMSTEVGLIPTAAPRTPVETFLPRQRGHEYYLDHDGEQFFVLSNREAKNFQLMATVSPGTPAAAWREILPHDPAVLLETFVLFESAIVVQEKENGLTTYRVIDRASGASQHVTFAESAWLTDLRDNVDYRATTLRLDYESMTTPPSVVDIHLATLERTPVYQEAVLGDFDPAQYRVERVHVPARDGTAVPVSIVARRDRGSEQPLLLYAYGSYSIAIDAGFSHTRLSLLERGFAMAIAHVRGGDDLGRGWYEAGRQEHKRNTFNDYVDVGRWLVGQGYCAPGALYGMGGSAGGLLMGVVANEAPELFHGIVAQVPFVDVVTTMLDEDLPLTTGEYDEWGDPRDQETYHFLLSYSPYDNVTAQAYPNLMVTAGLHDSQVQYFEPAKWVAKLRAQHTGEQLVLLRTEMEAGHGGASGRFEILHEIAREYAFILALAEEARASA